MTIDKKEIESLIAHAERTKRSIDNDIEGLKSNLLTKEYMTEIRRAYADVTLMKTTTKMYKDDFESEGDLEGDDRNPCNCEKSWLTLMEHVDNQLKKEKALVNEIRDKIERIEKAVGMK